jgi:glycine cleavage system H lipoate-binding protein
MAYMENFLGIRVEIPEDRRYVIKTGLWAKKEDLKIVFGFSRPALVLSGGLNDLEWLVVDGQEISQGESIVFAITGKILYLDAPLTGMIRLNPLVKENPSLVSQDPYHQGWLFAIGPTENSESIINSFSDFLEYMESLKTSEGCKNPQGLKGGVSGICKAVYSGIREQKIERSPS